MKISQKEFNNLFKAMVKLYGVIETDEIYELLNYYYDGITKKDIIEQVKKFYEKPKRDYFAAKIKNARNSYFLINNDLEDESIDYIIRERVGKPLYIPETKESLLEYAHEPNMTETEDGLYSELNRFLCKRYTGEDKEYQTFMITLYLYYNNRAKENTTSMINELTDHGFSFKDEKDIRKFLDLWMRVINNTKMFANKGFSPTELHKMSPKVDMTQLQLTLGPNIKEMFRTGELNPKEYLKQIEGADIPLVAKESLKAEINKIIAEQYNNRA